MEESLGYDGDVLAWPEGGVSPETPAQAGAGHRRLSVVPRAARSYPTGISPVYSSLSLLVKREVYLLPGGFQKRQLEPQG